MILPGGDKTTTMTFQKYVIARDKTTAQLKERLDLEELPKEMAENLDHYIFSLIGKTVTRDELFTGILMAITPRPTKLN